MPNKPDKNYLIVWISGGQWKIKYRHGEILGAMEKRSTAVRFAKSIARSENIDLIVNKKNGTVRDYYSKELLNKIDEPMPNKTNKNQSVEEISMDIHIKYLSKSEKAIVNGYEKTVLPYGYLSTAIEEAITQHNQELRDKVEGMKKEENSLKYKHEGETFKDRQHNEMRFMDQLYGYNQALDDVKKLLED